MGRYAGAGCADNMHRLGCCGLEALSDGRWLVTTEPDVVALARLIRYSEEEALRLGVSGVVVECLRMAGIELTNTIEKGNSAGGARAAKAAPMN